MQNECLYLCAEHVLQMIVTKTITPAHYDVGCPLLLHDSLADHLCYTCADYVLQMILTKMINPPITLAMSVAPRGSRVWQPPAAWIMYCSFNHLTISNRVYMGQAFLTECSFHHLAKSNNIHAFSAKAKPSNVCICIN